MTFSFAFIYWKFSVENVGSDISEPLNLKNFLGKHAPRPPSLQYLRRSNRSLCACTFRNLSYAKGIVLWYYRRTWVTCGFTYLKKEGPNNRSPEILYHILNWVNRNIPVQEEDAWGSSSPAFLSLRTGGPSVIWACGGVIWEFVWEK